MDIVAKNSLLYDFYGNLLTDRQKEIQKLYHEDNLSLSEIGEELNISRQGVHDALKKSEKTLVEYEEKLSLVDKFVKTEKAISQIDNIIDIIEKTNTDVDTKNNLEKIRKIIDDLND